MAEKQIFKTVLEKYDKSEATGIKAGNAKSKNRKND